LDYEHGKMAPESIEEELDYSARPFDYRDMDSSTSMVCEHDPTVRQKIRDKSENA